MERSGERIKVMRGKEKKKEDGLQRDSLSVVTMYEKLYMCMYTIICI